MNGTLSPFLPADLNLPPFDEFAAKLQREHGLGPEAARYHYDRLASDLVYVNDEYQVNLQKQPEHAFADAEIWHLSIKRRTKSPAHDWRDLQAIKNAIVGPEFEAIELYPASSRVVDTANQYHLWVFVRLAGVTAPRLPLGWSHRLVSGESSGGAVQRPLGSDGGASL